MLSLRLTSLNVFDITKHHGNITIWQTSAIEVIQLLKVCKKKNLSCVRGRQNYRSLQITVWHHSASLMMPDSDPQDGVFYLSLTPMIESYINPLYTEQTLPHNILEESDFNISYVQL